MITKFRNFIFIIVLLSLGGGIVSAQSADEVILQKPTEGTTISDTYEIEWKIVDADIENPAYFIDVFNLACTQNGGNLGRITNSDADIENNIYTYSWDTNSGNLANSLQNGGNYCMRVCGILADGGSVYSKCDKKSFVFSSETSGTNNQPKITPAKEGFNVTINEIFSYKVEASDPDGDELKYSFLNAPDFLQIDSKSGQISGKPTEVGDIRFIVKVDDSKGGIATEEFILNIQLTNTAKEVVFEFPKSDSTVTPENNIIKWKEKDGIIVRTITLSFSPDKAEWTEITKQDRDLGQYTWNINDIDDGEYYLKVLLVDENNKLYEIITDKFNISSKGAVSETEISDLNPEEGSTVDINRPVIRAVFKTPEGVTIDPEDVKFTLNERIDLTLCDITASSINCEIVSELSNDTYTAFIELSDSNGMTLVKEWKFTVNTSGVPSDQSEDTAGSSGSSMQLILIIFAVGFLLIALPWSMYLILKKRKNKKIETTKLPDNNVIHPITPLPSEPTQPVIGTQGLEMNEPQAMMANDSEQSQNPQTYEPVINIENTSVTPGSVYNPVIPADNTPSQADSVQVAPVNGISSIPSDISNQSSDIVPATGTPVVQPNVAQNTYPTDPKVMPTQGLPLQKSNIIPQQEVINSNGVTIPNYNDPGFDKPITTEQPAMYQQDEIPEWLTKDIEDTSTKVPSPTTTLDDIVTKTEILQGSKVYDPYGLALKADETEEPSSAN